MPGGFFTTEPPGSPSSLLYTFYSLKTSFKKMLSFLSPDCLFLFVLLSVFYFRGPARCLVHLDCALMIKSRGLVE